MAACLPSNIEKETETMMKDMYLEEHTCAFSNENEIEEAYQYYMEKNFGKEDTNEKHNI